MGDNENIRQFLNKQQFMVLAVTLDGGTPWAVPVKIQLHNGNEFEWDSKIETVHSRALETHPNMAITIFQKKESSQIGFYAKGRGELVETRDGGFGRYRFTVMQAWINDETFQKREVSII